MVQSEGHDFLKLPAVSLLAPHSFFGRLGTDKFHLPAITFHMVRIQYHSLLVNLLLQLI